MAQVTFDNAMAENNSNSQQQNGVGFFTLKNDGDSAIVRFMEESVNDFDLLICPNNNNCKYHLQ